MPLFGAQIDTSRIPIKGLIPEQSGSALGSPVEGLIWHDTVNKHIFAWLNGVWAQIDNVSGGSTPAGPAGGDLGGTYPNPNVVRAQNGFNIQGAGQGTAITWNTVGPNGLADALNVRITADSQPRFDLTAGGMLNFGDGATTPDTNLYRSGANALKTDDSFSAASMTSGGQAVVVTTDSRLSDSRSPSGAAGGDLTGSYPNPTIGTGKVTSTHIADGTITDTDVATANKDGALATPSMRTLGNGALQAMPGPTSLAGIGAVNASTSSISASSQKIINLADGTAATDAVTKQQLDAMSAGLDPKQSVKAASTTNIASGAPVGGPQTIDGYAVAGGDRILIKNQSLPQNNGIFSANLGGTWTRVTDMDNWSEVPGAFVFVEQGTTQADTGWVSTADQGGTINTTPMPWTQFSGPGTVSAGAGLTSTANTLDVGAGAGIQVNADSVQVADNGITNAMIADGAINLGTADVTGTLPITKGGTGATTAAAARAALSTPYIVSATVPALPTPGAYVTVPGISKPGGGPIAVLTVGFGFAASGDTQSSGEVFLDWKTRGVSEDFQVKADVAVPGSTYVVTVVMAG